jgi:hypothetical protein
MVVIKNGKNGKTTIEKQFQRLEYRDITTLSIIGGFEAPLVRLPSATV